MAQSQIRPQPDFRVISDCHQTLAAEMRKVPDMPQFDLGNAILAELQGMNVRLGRIETRLDGVETRLTRVEERLDAVEMRQRVSDHNNAARISNTLLLASTDTLEPFVNPRNNNPIAGFPTTPAEIGTMVTQSLNNVLRELDLGTDGSKALKEQRLRVHIGLKRNPA